MLDPHPLQQIKVLAIVMTAVVDSSTPPPLSAAYLAQMRLAAAAAAEVQAHAEATGQASVAELMQWLERSCQIQEDTPEQQPLLPPGMTLRLAAAGLSPMVPSSSSMNWEMPSSSMGSADGSTGQGGPQPSSDAKSRSAQGRAGASAARPKAKAGPAGEKQRTSCVGAPSGTEVMFRQKNFGCFPLGGAPVAQKWTTGKPSQIPEPERKARDTLRTYLEELRNEDPRCIFIARRINKLGFRSKSLLERHYAQYGEVSQVLVAHSKVKPFKSSGSWTFPRTRPGNFGLVVMRSPEVVQRILAEGPLQVIMGVEIQAFQFEHVAMSAEAEAEADEPEGDEQGDGGNDASMTSGSSCSNGGGAGTQDGHLQSLATTRCSSSGSNKKSSYQNSQGSQGSNASSSNKMSSEQNWQGSQGSHASSSNMKSSDQNSQGSQGSQGSRASRKTSSAQISQGSQGSHASSSNQMLSSQMWQSSHGSRASSSNKKQSSDQNSQESQDSQASSSNKKSSERSQGSHASSSNKKSSECSQRSQTSSSLECAPTASSQSRLHASLHAPSGSEPGVLPSPLDAAKHEAGERHGGRRGSFKDAQLFGDRVRQHAPRASASDDGSVPDCYKDVAGSIHGILMSVLGELSGIAADRQVIGSMTPEQSMQALALAQWAHQSLHDLEEECQQRAAELLSMHPSMPSGLPRAPLMMPTQPAGHSLGRAPPMPAGLQSAVPYMPPAPGLPLPMEGGMLAPGALGQQSTPYGSWCGLQHQPVVPPVMASGNGLPPQPLQPTLPPEPLSQPKAPGLSAAQLGAHLEGSLRTRPTPSSQSNQSSQEDYSTLRSHLTELRSKDQNCIFITRRINKLGFRSREVLHQHFSQYGEVGRVLVAHSKVKPLHDPSAQLRTRPGRLGLIMMQSAESVRHILSLGEEQMVAGHQIQVQCFEKPKVDEAAFDGKSTSVTTGSTSSSSHRLLRAHGLSAVWPEEYEENEPDKPDGGGFSEPAGKCDADVGSSGPESPYSTS